MLLYSIPTSGFSSGRKNRFGHVKMYMGQGKRVGHWSGVGSIVIDANSDAKWYIISQRYNKTEALHLLLLKQLQLDQINKSINTDKKNIIKGNCEHFG